MVFAKERKAAPLALDQGLLIVEIRRCPLPRHDHEPPEGCKKQPIAEYAEAFLPKEDTKVNCKGAACCPRRFCAIVLDPGNGTRSFAEESNLRRCCCRFWTLHARRCRSEPEFLTSHRDEQAGAQNGRQARIGQHATFPSAPQKSGFVRARRVCCVS